MVVELWVIIDDGGGGIPQVKLDDTGGDGGMSQVKLDVIGGDGGMPQVQPDGIGGNDILGFLGMVLLGLEVVVRDEVVAFVGDMLLIADLLHISEDLLAMVVVLDASDKSLSIVDVLVVTEV